MKKWTFLGMALAAAAGFSQPLSINFETTVSGMQGYDGATFTAVPNPSTSGNTSATVGKIVKVAPGNLWAGGKITGLPALDFANASSRVLSLKVLTNEPVGTVIKIKLEGPYTAEVDAITTVSGYWETLIFDFGLTASMGSTDLVIMPQPFTSGGGKTFYFDDIQQLPGTVPSSLAGLPLDFEGSPTAAHFFDFESAFLTVVSNPAPSSANPSATVGKVVRYLGAPFGGSKITFTQPIDFSTQTVLTMKVWTTAPVGTPVTLKTEKPFWGVERSVQTTKSEEWETLSFDFAGSLSDMPSLVFLFDFVAGSTNVGNGSAQSTFYFDDVQYLNGGISTGPEINLLGARAVPNPSSDFWTISPAQEAAFSFQLFDIQGNLLEEHRSETSLRLDASGLASGMYLGVLTTDQGTETLRLMKP